jgi:2-polyprenyl-3-methyl-5-hydroxy-6-metoxy-1,4-benzoquinol methylase
MEQQDARELVLFDFDGTVVHLGTDYPRLRAELERLAEEAGIDKDGRTIYDLSLLLADDGRADQLVSDAELRGLERGHELPLGVELYRRYAETGADLAVVTHNTRKVVERFFQTRDLPAPAKIFDRRALGALKADSDALAEYVNGAASVVVVGDSHYDRALADRLGATFVDAGDELRGYYETRAGELDELALTYEHPEPYKRFFYETRFRAVLAALDPQPGDEILDVGCGSGLYTRVLAERGARVVATEFAPTPLALAKRNVGELGRDVEFRLEDAQALSLPAGRFDKVLLTEVIEHVPDPARAVAEAARVLRPGGVLAISTPSRFSPLNLAYGLKRRIRRYAFNEHLHEFTPTSFRRLLEERFEVERLEFANYVLPYPADELYLRAGSPGLGLLRRLEETLARTPVVRQLGWTMVARARTPLR